MAELHLNGYITRDEDDIVALTDEDPNEKEFPWERYGYSIINKIQHFADDGNGVYGRHHKGLGGHSSYIDNCSIRIYFTDKECEFEEAMESLLNFMYSGDIKTKTNYTGYSEYTITGLDLEEFTIGGHDLSAEILSHWGEYAHIIIEC